MVSRTSGGGSVQIGHDGHLYQGLAGVSVPLSRCTEARIPNPSHITDLNPDKRDDMMSPTSCRGSMQMGRGGRLHHSPLVLLSRIVPLYQVRTPIRPRASTTTWYTGRHDVLCIVLMVGTKGHTGRLYQGPLGVGVPIVSVYRGRNTGRVPEHQSQPGKQDTLMSPTSYRETVQMGRVGHLHPSFLVLLSHVCPFVPTRVTMFVLEHRPQRGTRDNMMSYASCRWLV
jgi:hypothetical protein